MIIFSYILAFIDYLKSLISPSQRTILLRKLQKAQQYKEWFDIALKLDQETKQWQHQEKSQYYDYKLIKKYIVEMKKARQQNKIQDLKNILMECSNRNVGNILDYRLYLEAYTCTKTLIQNFLDEYDKCLIHLKKANCSQEFFIQLNKQVGQTAILFSGGAILGLYSCGVANVLDELNILPKVMTGSSAGSIAVSLFGTTTDIQKILSPNYYNYTVFQKENKFKELWRFFTKGYLLDKTQMIAFLQNAYGDITFKEAYELTGRVMNIMVSGKEGSSEDLLLNYLNSPDAVVWSAVCCSCSLPGVYDSSYLYYKKDGKLIKGSKRYIDGSISCDLPFKQLLPFNVNYSIVSQTNPWILHMLNSKLYSRNNEHHFKKLLRSFIEKIKQFILREVKLRTQQIVSLNLLPDLAQRMANLFYQNYDGDITIWPKTILLDYYKLSDNPDEYTVQRMKIGGQMRTFERICQIKTATHMERSLQKYV